MEPAPDQRCGLGQPRWYGNQAYWQRILQNNLDSLKNDTIPTMNTAAGAVAGHFPGNYRGDGTSRLQVSVFHQDMISGRWQQWPRVAAPMRESS